MAGPVLELQTAWHPDATQALADLIEYPVEVEVEAVNAGRAQLWRGVGECAGTWLLTCVRGEVLELLAVRGRRLDRVLPLMDQFARSNRLRSIWCASPRKGADRYLRPHGFEPEGLTPDGLQSFRKTL